MHVTIQRGRSLPKIERCTTCCQQFHCPFCSSAFFRPAKWSKVETHLGLHMKRAIIHEGYTIHRCGLGCRPRLHYHCVNCQATLLRATDFVHHLSLCKKKQSSLTDSVTPAPSPPDTPATPATAALSDAPDTPSPSGAPYTPSPCAPPDVPLPFSIPAFPTGRIQRVRVKPVQQKKCPVCQIIVNKKNLKKHIIRRHTGTPKDITGISHLESTCIDPLNGIYNVQKSFHSTSTLLHVQTKMWGEDQRFFCESEECQSTMELAWKNGQKAFQCIHLRSVTYCSSYASSDVLLQETLNEMVDGNWFGDDKRRICLDLQNTAESHQVPLSVLAEVGSPHCKYVSVYEPNVFFYSRLGRVVVTFNTKTNSWHCPCERSKQSCPHAYIAKWHLFQTQPHLFKKVQNMEQVEYPDTVTSPGDRESEDEADEGDMLYPPKNIPKLKQMVEYILQSKKIPAVLPDNLRLPSPQNQYPWHLVPEETICQLCPGGVPLSEPFLVTTKAQILTNTTIIHDVSTYCKYCYQCGSYYRYQEWKDGLHNFNDKILLDLPLCLCIRNMLQVHTSVSRVVEYLELSTGLQFPSPDTVLQGYLHFEALSEHEYQYTCATCGDHPPVVIMDLHKTGSLHWLAAELAQPPEGFSGDVDMECFWEELSVERIAQGFVTSHGKNPFAVAPSFHFWAPWIGKNTRRSNNVLNTEFEKNYQMIPTNTGDVMVTEERLRDELYKQKVEVLKTLCRECGLVASGSRCELLRRLSDKMKSREVYDKVSQKFWDASGGWAVIMCPCSVVYSIKFNIRTESPRDFTDMLLSWKYIPNIIIHDFAGGLATHMNMREPKWLPFQPFEGLLCEPTPENIKQAKNGKLKVSLPWLNCPKESPDCDGHPVTGSAEHYALYDRSHEDFTQDPSDVLRKLSLVQQLAGKVNSEIAEQFLARMKKNNYFLDMTLPSAHLFLMRNIIHHYNTQKNKH